MDVNNREKMMVLQSLELDSVLKGQQSNKPADDSAINANQTKGRENHSQLYK